jgi:hypothetical protein
MRLEFSALPTRYEIGLFMQHYQQGMRLEFQHYQQGMRLEFSASPTRYEIGVFSIINKV